MEYMRKEADQREEASNQTSNNEENKSTDVAELEMTTQVAAWQEVQKKGKPVNWANRMQTIGKMRNS